MCSISVIETVYADGVWTFVDLPGTYYDHVQATWAVIVVCKGVFTDKSDKMKRCEH